MHTLVFTLWTIGYKLFINFVWDATHHEPFILGLADVNRLCEHIVLYFMIELFLYPNVNAIYYVWLNDFGSCQFFDESILVEFFYMANFMSGLDK